MFLPRLAPRFDVALVDADSTDPVFRREAAMALGGAATDAEREQARLPLRRLLRDDVAPVRLAAAEALGRLGLSTEGPVLESALDDADGSVREAAAVALASLPEADAALLRALDARHADVRFQAALGLGDRRHEPARARLVALLGDADPLLREAALLALTELGAAPHADAFAGALGDVPAVALVAAVGLAGLGDARAAPALARALGDREVPAGVLEAAAKVRADVLVEPLARWAQKPFADPLRRMTAAAALAHHGDARGFAVLDAGLGSFFLRRRAAAVVAIGAVRLRERLPALVALVERPRGLPRDLLAHTLERFEQEPAAAAALAALDRSR